MHASFFAMKKINTWGRHLKLITLCMALLGLPLFTAHVQASEEPDQTAEAEKIFNELFGKDYQTVQRTRRDLEDDHLLIQRILEQSTSMDQKLAPIAVYFATMTLELSVKNQDVPNALASMRAIVQRDKNQKRLAYEKLLPLFEKATRATRKVGYIHNARAQVRALLLTAQACIEQEDWVSASKYAREAVGLANRAKLSNAETIENWSTRLKDLQREQLWLNNALERLERDPDDTKTQADLLEAMLLRFGKPIEANQYVEVTEDETWKANLPLAAKPVKELTPEQMLTLGDWFKNDLAIHPKATAKSELLQLAATYYEAFLKATPETDEINVLKANLMLETVINELNDSPELATPLPRKAGFIAPVNPAIDREIVSKARQYSRLPAGERAEELFDWIRETNEGDDIRVHKRERGTTVEAYVFNYSGALKDITPLYGTDVKQLSFFRCGNLESVLPLQASKVESLNLAHARKLKSLAGIEGLPIRSLSINGTRNLPGYEEISTLRQLRSLNISDTGFRNLSMFKSLQIESLTISDCKYLTDISVLKEFRNLKHLNINNCRNIKDISVLGDLKLETLHLNNVGAFQELDILKHMKLKQLSVAGTEITSLKPIAHMPLERLNISNTKNLESIDELRALKGTLHTLTIADSDHLIQGDLSILNKLGLKLRDLNVNGNDAITSIAGLGGMPLQYLRIRNCKNVKNLNPIRAYPVRGVDCANIPSLGRNDWNILKAKNLRWVNTGNRGINMEIVPPRR